MATAVLMPRQGQSVESCIIVEWKKQVGDTVAVDENLCDVETDKATLEVPSPVAGVLLAHFYAAGDEVPVLETIAAIGEAGEDVSALNPHGANAPAESAAPPAAEPAPTAPTAADTAAAAASVGSPTSASAAQESGSGAPASPRARGLAARKGVDVHALAGTGPEGRIIERDVQAAVAAQPRLTPVAKAMVADGGFVAPAQGSGMGGRVTSRDLVTAGEPSATMPAAPQVAIPASQPASADDVAATPVRGVRKVIAERMLASLQTTAQLTLNSFADARALQGYRKRLKESPEALGLRGVTINDLLLFAVSRALLDHPDVNAIFTDNTIYQHKRVQLGMAVDTARGLMVPVLRDAHLLSLRQIASGSKRLATAAQEGKSAPDDLAGGTFTVTNLGGLGIESFTPILNPPQVAILGVGGINLRPISVAGSVEFVPHIGLSLTINHQLVDGAPGARFLQTLAQIIANIDLALAA